MCKMNPVYNLGEFQATNGLNLQSQIFVRDHLTL